MQLDDKAPGQDSSGSQVPAQYNIAQQCCRRWAEDRSRFALYYEDDTGAMGAWSFWDIQRTANRLSNALGALGTLRGERIAVLLPQRPETAIAHIACYQMGAVAVPLPHLIGAEALAYRLDHAEARIAISDGSTLPHLSALRERLPRLRHVIGVGGALEAGVHDWHRLLEYASPRYTPLLTSADDPAQIIHAGGPSAHAKGALTAQRALFANLPGFLHAHDSYPKAGDMFWSPADWGSAGGLFGGLLPAWNFGQPILAYRGRFDPEKAYWLIAKYGIRNTFLVPAALKMMMQALPKPTEKYDTDLNLRTLACGGAAAGDTLTDWARAELGVTIRAGWSGTGRLALDDEEAFFGGQAQ